MLYQFGTVKDGLFKFVGKFQGIVRTGVHTQLAEDAATQIVDVIIKHTFGLTVFGLDFLGDNLYRVVGTVHLAYTTCNTFVMAFGIEL